MNMRIEEIEHHPAKIYLDLDGVVVWLDKAIAEYNNVSLAEYDLLGFNNKYWTNVLNTANLKDFFANAEWESNGKSMLGWILSQYIPVTFLSRPVREPGTKDCIAGKNIWLHRHGVSVIPVIYEFDKEKYATTKGRPNILIDDHPDNINKWNAAGGIGILYKNAWFPEVISKLNKIYGIT
jgi:hypothetical protein